MRTVHLLGLLLAYLCALSYALPKESNTKLRASVPNLSEGAPGVVQPPGAKKEAAVLEGPQREGKDPADEEAVAEADVKKKLEQGQCEEVECEHGGVFSVDGCVCTCKGNWSGPNCSLCNLSCMNGGEQDLENCSCSCKNGFEGDTCEVQPAPKTEAPGVPATPSPATLSPIGVDTPSNSPEEPPHVAPPKDADADPEMAGVINTGDDGEKKCDLSTKCPPHSSLDPGTCTCVCESWVDPSGAKCTWTGPKCDIGMCGEPPKSACDIKDKTKCAPYGHLDVKTCKCECDTWIDDHTGAECLAHGDTCKAWSCHVDGLDRVKRSCQLKAEDCIHGRLRLGTCDCECNSWLDRRGEKCKAFGPNCATVSCAPELPPIPVNVKCLLKDEDCGPHGLVREMGCECVCQTWVNEQGQTCSSDGPNCSVISCDGGDPTGETAPLCKLTDAACNNGMLAPEACKCVCDKWENNGKECRALGELCGEVQCKTHGEWSAWEEAQRVANAKAETLGKMEQAAGQAARPNTPTEQEQAVPVALKVAPRPGATPAKEGVHPIGQT